MNAYHAVGAMLGLIALVGVFAGIVALHWSTDVAAWSGERDRLRQEMWGCWLVALLAAILALAAWR